MSAFNDIDITCEECGDDFRGTVWTGVHAGEDPELKELLLGGELNMVMCPHCSHVAFQDQFVLYQEPKAELVAYVYPEVQSGEAETLRTLMTRSFQEAQEVLKPKDRLHYPPILLFGLEALVELLHDEESRAEQSQIAQELCHLKGIPYSLLRPSEARRMNSVRVLPSSTHEIKHSREHLLAGLKQLLTLNPTLTLYAELQKRIEADPHFQGDLSFVGTSSPKT